MLEYKCDDCGMGVKGLTCSQCGSVLVHKKITLEDGKQVNVSECQKGCGKIKSPICCGKDMKPK